MLYYFKDEVDNYPKEEFCFSQEVAYSGYQGGNCWGDEAEEWEDYNCKIDFSNIVIILNAFGINEITKINFRYQELIQCPDLSELTNLKFLTLYANRLINLKNIQDNETIEKLYLHYNFLPETTIYDLSKMKSLKELYIEDYQSKVGEIILADSLKNIIINDVKSDNFFSVLENILNLPNIKDVSLTKIMKSKAEEKAFEDDLKKLLSVEKYKKTFNKLTNFKLTINYLKENTYYSGRYNKHNIKDLLNENIESIELGM